MTCGTTPQNSHNASERPAAEAISAMGQLFDLNPVNGTGALAPRDVDESVRSSPIPL